MRYLAYTVLIFIVFSFVVIYAFARLRKTRDFLSYHTRQSEFVLKHSRNEMVSFAVRMWSVIFIVSLCSFHFFWIITSIILMYTAVLYSYFVKSWKFHGYAPLVLHVSTGIATVISFSVSPVIRGLISSVLLF
jgi:hypothetical protein